MRASNFCIRHFVDFLDRPRMEKLIVAVLVTSSLWLAQSAAALEIALIDAANAGDVGAQIAAGDIEFEHGNYVEAMHWYILAAEQGNPKAQASVGILYRAGLGVNRNCSQAKDWFLKASNQGDPVAMHFLENEGMLCKVRMVANGSSERLFSILLGLVPLVD